MRVVDLYCGAGGASDGLSAGGWPVSLAVDLDPLCLRSHALEHPDAEHLQGEAAIDTGERA